MKNIFKKIYWILSSQFGINLMHFAKSCRGLPKYLNDLIRFRKLYKGRLYILPCLYDWYEEGGTARGEYFWQDLHVAQEIFKSNPSRHVDIGSRIDGFVAHVACYREIEVFDIRPILSEIPNVIFKQADLMNDSVLLVDYCDSLSCLHALEHFGLGRYGDPVDPMGYIDGFANMAKMLSTGGSFYLSVPIGLERVEFNAHRIFNPHTLVKLAEENGLFLNMFAWIANGHTVIESSDVRLDINNLSKLPYTLGIFTFIKR